MSRAEKLVAAFADAVAEHAFLGTIPIYSDDPEEQREINAARQRLKSNLTRTRNRLLKEFEND